MNWQDKLTAKQRVTAKKVAAAAERHGVPPQLALAMAMQESTLNQGKRSKTGPTGVMMLGRKAAKDLGVDRFNEDQNIEGGVRYIKSLLDKHGGDVDRALVAYHDGPNSAYFKGGDMSPAAANHIQKVKGYADMADNKSPSKYNIVVQDVEPVQPVEFTDTGTGNIYGDSNDLGIGDWLAGGVGAAAGAKFGPNRKRSVAEVEAQRSNAQRVIQENRADVKAHEEELKRIAREEQYALELRNQALQAAQQKQATTGQDPKTWMRGQYGSDISAVEGRDILNQKEAEAAGKAGVQRVRQVQAMMPGAAPDPTTGIWLSPEALAQRPVAPRAPTLAEQFPIPAPMERPPFPVQRDIPPIHVGSRMGTLSNALAAGVAGQQATSAIDKVNEGNLIGGGLSAITAGGAGATMAPGLSPKAKLGAAGVAAGSGALNYLYNKFLDKKQPQSVLEKQSYADGGKVVKKLLGAVESPLSRISEYAHSIFDPRFDERVKEQTKLAALRPRVEATGPVEIPKVSLVDFEGRPFITSMSDRTAAGGNLIGVGDVDFKRPVALKGGQDFMFNNPGQVWASGKSPTRQIMSAASALRDFTGQDPLYIPWRMAPTGGDFAHMTGQSMLAQAEANLNKTQKRALDKQIRSFLPDWAGVDSPDSLSQFAAAPSAQRKAIQNMMDKDFREVGGLGIGEARLSVADPRQVAAPEGGLMNVGMIHADKPMVKHSGHESYPFGIPGEGLGTLDRELQVYQMLPHAAEQRGIPDVMKPSQSDLRALQMKPYAGVIDDKLLKALGY